MKTQTNAPETTMPDTKPTTTTKSPAKTYSITLTAPGARLVLLAMRKEDGALTTATTVDLTTKKSTRGMTERHKSFDLAVGAIRKQAEAAEKLGWTHRPAGRIFAAKPDAFSTLPAAPGAPVAAPATKGKK